MGLFFSLSQEKSQIRLGLGPIQTVDLLLARTKPREYRLLLLDGKDALSERRRERTGEHG